MLFPHVVLNVAAAAAKEKTRYALNGVRIECAEDVATFAASDGRRLAVVTVDRDRFDPMDYPEIGVNPAAQGAESLRALVPAKAFADLGRLAPKKSIRPVLSNIVLEEERDQGASRVTFAGTDLEVKNVTQVRELEGQFPDYREVMPKDDSKRETVTVNAQYLREAIALVEKCTAPGGKDAEDPTVTLSFGRKGGKLDPADVVVVRGMKRDGVKAEAFAMPINKD